MKKPNYTSLLAIGLLLAGGMPVGAEEPVINPNFEEGGAQSSESGSPDVMGWQLYRWGAPEGSGSYGVSEEEAGEGKQSAFVAAVSEGAIGWMSKPIILTDDMRQHLEIRVQVKKSPNYEGNTPWIFVSWHSQKEFLGTLNIPLETLPSGEWGVAVLKIKPVDIPAGSDSFRLNLTTLRGKMTGEAHGQLYFDDVKVMTGSTGTGN